MNENHMIGIPTPFIATQGIIRDEQKKRHGYRIYADEQLFCKVCEEYILSVLVKLFYNFIHKLIDSRRYYIIHFFFNQISVFFFYILIYFMLKLNTLRCNFELNVIGRKYDINTLTNIHIM